MTNEFNYVVTLHLDDITSYITQITFNISRYGNYTHTLCFDEQVTEKAAVNSVEKWLSNKAGKNQIEMIKSDLFGDPYEMFGESPTRYNLIGESKFLDLLDKISYNHVRIVCGS